MATRTYGQFEHNDPAFVKWLSDLGVIDHENDGRAGTNGYFWKEDRVEGVLHDLFKVATAADDINENMCQSCLIDGERSPVTGRQYTDTCGHRKKLHAALALLNRRRR